MAADNFVFLSGQIPGLNSDARLFIDALQNVINTGNHLDKTLTQANLDGTTALAGYLGFATTNAADNASRLQVLVHSVMTDLNNPTNNGFIAQLLSQFG